MSYQHGAGAEIGNDKVKSAVQVDTVVAYIGTAPINLVLGYKEKGLINTPIKLENMPKTQATVGYSSNWDKFTLCEPFDCHFANTIGNVGPIYIINVLDPAVHQKDVKTTVELTFKNGRAEYVTDTIILDTFALSDKVLGTDYSLDYNYTKGAVVIESLNDADPITGTVEASFTRGGSVSRNQRRHYRKRYSLRQEDRTAGSLQALHYVQCRAQRSGCTVLERRSLSLQSYGFGGSKIKRTLGRFCKRRYTNL